MDKYMKSYWKYTFTHAQSKKSWSESASIIEMEINKFIFLIFFLGEMLIWEGEERATKWHICSSRWQKIYQDKCLPFCCKQIFSVRLLQGFTHVCSTISNFSPGIKYILTPVIIKSTDSRNEIQGSFTYRRRNYDPGHGELTQPDYSFFFLCTLQMLLTRKEKEMRLWMEQVKYHLSGLRSRPLSKGLAGLATGQGQLCRHPLRSPLTLPCWSWICSGVVLGSSQAPRRHLVP